MTPTLDDPLRRRSRWSRRVDLRFGPGIESWYMIQRFGGLSLLYRLADLGGPFEAHPIGRYPTLASAEAAARRAEEERLATARSGPDGGADSGGRNPAT